MGDCDERNTASAKLLERPGLKLQKTADCSYKEDSGGSPITIGARVHKPTE